MLFAVVAVLATALSAWIAYDRVGVAFTSEFESRLERAAATAASQIAADLIAEIQDGGDESADYATVQVQLVTLRSATGVADASLIDPGGMTLVDARQPEGNERMPTALDTLAHDALEQALAGAPAVSAPYRRNGDWLRAGLAPVMDGRDVAGVVAIEAQTSYAPALDALGRTLALIALISIVAIGILATLIVRAAQAGARLERRLSRAENLAAMGRLTATLAHEIKNPLAIIRGSAERLKKLEPEAQRMADFVIEETDRLSRTVSRYLQFAKGDDVVREHGDAAAALDATLALLEGELRSRSVTLERSRSIEPPAWVPLDSESLKQVYLNLILNAVEAMPEGGRIEIAEREHHGKIEVAIRDHGQGIPLDDLKRLGSPFYTTKAQGSGLGLFLTRRLVQTSGGDLEIDSEIGKGTSCVVKLPRTRG